MSPSPSALSAAAVCVLCLSIAVAVTSAALAGVAASPAVQQKHVRRRPPPRKPRPGGGENLKRQDPTLGAVKDLLTSQAKSGRSYVSYAAADAALRKCKYGAHDAIPRLLWRTADFDDEAGMPAGGVHSLTATAALSPGYVQVYCTPRDRRQLLAQHLPPVVLEAYDALAAPAFKADLWRLAILFVHGGVYMDYGMQLLVPMADVVDAATDDFVAAVDHLPDALSQAFLAARPRSGLVAALLGEVVTNVGRRNYGVGPLDVTGPMAVHRALLRHFGDMDVTALPVGRFHVSTAHLAGQATKTTTTQLHLLRHNRKGRETSTLDNADGVPCVATKFPGYYAAMYIDRGVPYYTNAWYDGTIFVDNNDGAPFIYTSERARQ